MKTSLLRVRMITPLPFNLSNILFFNFTFAFLFAALAVPAQAQTAFKSLNYLYAISGNKVLTGQHNDQKDGTTAATYTGRVNTITGKFPALYSGDFLFHGSSQLRWDITYEAERQWNAGAVVNLMWHACPPTQGAVCDWEGGIKSYLNDAQWNDLVTDGGYLNGVWKARMDEIAVYLQYLKDRGVEVMWRPLHEMNQGVFWWAGRTGTNGTQRLYRMTHDYMKNVKGLTNLIWVWDVQDLSTNYADYNPGSAYFDVAALDVYGDGYTNRAYYDALVAQAGNKPVGIGESFNLPAASVLQNQPRWAFFMIWAYGLQQNNTDATIRDVYNNPALLTRDEMPGWIRNVPANLATGKTVTASSTEAGLNIPANAVDGVYSSRWSSQYADPQWLMVDLGANYNINQVKITWEAAYGKDYTLQVSKDAVNWSTIKTVTGNTSLSNDHTGLIGSGRYVRMNGSARGTVYGYSIYELEVYGSAVVANQAPAVTLTSPANTARFTAPASVNISADASDKDGTIAKVSFYNGSTLLGSKTSAPYTFTWSNVPAGSYSITAKATDNSGAVSTSAAANIIVGTIPQNLAYARPVVASSTEDAAFPPTNAVDANGNTRWSSQYSDAQWIYVDLGSSYNINRVRIAWEAAYGKDYTVQVSSNAGTWSTIKTVSGNTSLVNDLTGLSGTARYVRINATARGTPWGYSIFEFEVYGNPAGGSTGGTGGSTGNQAPQVTITSPANNASFTAGSTININTNASDIDGSVARVDYYSGGVLIGSDGTAPFSLAWSNATPGTYTITAKATDNNGAVTTSVPVTVVVTAAVAAKKVIAYLANWIDLNTYANQVDYAKLTHINLAFENPNTNGDLSFNQASDTLIQKAHANHVKVFVSIGGGSIAGDDNARNNYFSLISDSRRAGFVAKIAAYVQGHGFDGLDVDLEGPAINADYGKFIVDLGNALKPAGKGLTAAVSQGYGGADIPNYTFSSFDWINIMAYDAVGPWDPSNPGQHSSLDFAKSNLAYWLGRGLPKSKAVLGVPFYGYGFGANAGDYTYQTIMDIYPGSENLDQVGNTIWYNGIPTIKAKVNHVFDQQIAGVMIWELSQDASGPKSLLLAIDQVMKARAP